MEEQFTFKAFVYLVVDQQINSTAEVTRKINWSASSPRHSAQIPRLQRSASSVFPSLRKHWQKQFHKSGLAQKRGENASQLDINSGPIKIKHPIS